MSRPLLFSVPVPAPVPVAVEYPDSDGKPMADNDAQADVIHYAKGALRVHYAGRKKVYVSGDLLVYYEEGNPRVSVAPDTLVAFGVKKGQRGSYKVWEEGKGPDFVLEVASPSTWWEDLIEKTEVYSGLGVSEYFLFDPRGEHLRPRLRGFRLVEGEYREHVELEESHDGTLRMYSEVLALELRARFRELRFHDPETGETLPSLEEVHAAHRMTLARAEAAEAKLEALLREKSC